MTFGQIIKKMRQDRNMTQEKLAELLSVSPQAVSRWENDAAMPDISMIPILCNFFDITSDELLGINLKKKEEKIKEIIDNAHNVEKETGDFARSVEILRKGLAFFPYAYSIMYELAASLICCYTRGQGVINCDEAIDLCNRILKGNTDTKLRNRAIQTLCAAYRFTKNKEALLQLAEEIPEASFSKEDILFHSLSGKEFVEKIREYILFCFSRTVGGLHKLAETKEAEQYVFDIDDRITLYKQAVNITKTFFSDGDYNFFAQFGGNPCYGMALAYMEKGDMKNAVISLNEAADFDIHFDTYDKNALHTSLSVRGICDGGWIMEKEGNRSAQLLQDLETEKPWEALRGDDRFGSILEKLKKYAKKPE